MGAVVPDGRYALYLNREFVRTLNELGLLSALKWSLGNDAEVSGSDALARNFRNAVAHRPERRSMIADGELISIQGLFHDLRLTGRKAL